MTKSTSKPIQPNTPCIGCGGSGQTSYFGGESRFMFTWEDCPDCHGTGVILEENSQDEETKQIMPNSVSKKTS